MKKVLLLYNPLIERRPRRGRDFVRVKKTLAAAGIRAEVQPTAPDHGAADQVRSAIGCGFCAVMVCGGDGTIFDVVQGAVGTSMPVGVLPFGTGNVLAQNLRIPLDPVQAVRALLLSTPRVIPLGRITCGPEEGAQRSWYFLFSAGLGMHASLLGASVAWGKHRIGRAAYYAAGIDLLLRGRISPFQMETTDREGRVEVNDCCEAIGVRVGELNRWRPGGDLDGRSIRIVAVPGDSRAALARASYHAIVHRGSVIANGHLPGSAIVGDYVRVVFRPLERYTYSAPIPVQADGEVLGASSATLEMTQERVTLLQPK
jgi:diacylglycerol kinase (ATP)